MPEQQLNTGGLDIRAAIRLLEAHNTDSLPSPSSVARKLLTLSTSDTASTRDIAQVVKADPALCGRLLKLANSPLVGFSRPIAVIDDAIIVLGVQAVHKLAIGMSVLDKSRQGACPEFDYDAYWRHCILRASAAQILAAESQSFNPGEAFSVALLADIGKLALATLYPSLYARTLAAYTLIAEPDRPGKTALMALEREHFATDHAELSHVLLSDWGFIEVHLLGLKMYHQPNDAAQTGRTENLARILIGAELSAAYLADGATKRPSAQPLHSLFGNRLPAAWDYCGYLDNIRSSAAQWDSLLGLPEAESAPPVADTDADIGVDMGAVADADSLSADAIEVCEFNEQTSRILIADDDPLVRSVLTAILANDGYHIVEATDGEHALNTCLKDRPDIVILDWEMPNLSGIQVLKALRRSRLSSLYYVIVLTAHSEESNLVAAFAAGADDFIAKPVSPAELSARVAAASRLVHLRHQVEQERSHSREHIAQLSVVARRMRDAALTDFLTGLPNRCSILDFLNGAWSTSDRSGMPLSCLLVDIDHFKAINDAHGHDAGDLVLRDVARILRDNLRSGDNMGRLGGEEFLVVATLTDHYAAMLLGERLRTAVANHDFGAIAPIERLTISIGIATREMDMCSPSELVTRADSGLLGSKRAGRNQCRRGQKTA